MLSVIKGTISDLGQETRRHVSWQKTAGGGVNAPAVRHETLTTFKVDNRWITLSAGPRPQLDNGDEVVVAGMGSGSFKGLAFKNLSKNVTWGNNLLNVIFAVLLILLGLVITPERLLSWNIIDFQVYRDFFSSGPPSFGRMDFPGRQFLSFLRIIACVAGGFSLVTGLPRLIAYMRIKDA